MENIRYLTKKEASVYLTQGLGLPVSEKSLSKYITSGGGPQYQKFGRRVVYLESYLSDWVQSRLSQPRINSTAEEA